MAKKARRKLEEEEAAAFEFPPFDEDGFAKKEFELGTGLILAGVITIAIGFVSWLLSVSGLPWFVPLALGILVIAASPFLVLRLRQQATMFTKGDWAGLIAMEFFGWFALWFVLLNVAPKPI
jgi:hypothetical protein